MRTAILSLLIAGVILLAGRVDVCAADGPIRIGIVGCDTSHATKFTKVFMDSQAEAEFAGMRITTAYPTSSADVVASTTRVAGFTKALKEMGIEIVGSLDELLRKVDVVLLLSVDGRQHLPQARAILTAGKPLFIDKPLSDNLADAMVIVQLAAEKHVPLYSGSAARYGANIEALMSIRAFGMLRGADVYGPSPTEPHHGAFFWYGVHGVEMLFTIMGTGCDQVTCIHSADADLAVGTWRGGQVASIRGVRPYSAFGGTVFGSQRIESFTQPFEYKPFMIAIARFFRDKKPPVSPEQTLEIIAFMEAADVSIRRHGAAVKMADVMASARQRIGQRNGASSDKQRSDTKP